MPTIVTFDKPKIKPVVELFLSTSANFKDKFPSQFKRPMRLIMTENIPMICLGDGFTFIEAHFTKEAINDFRKNFSHMRFSSLRDRIIYVQRWSLHLRQRDSNKHLCAYNNLTVSLFVEQFKPITHEIPASRQICATNNLYDSPEVRTMLDSARHNFVTNLIDNKYSSMAELNTPMGLGKAEMPSFQSLMKKEEEEPAGSSIAAAGLVRLNQAIPESIEVTKGTDGRFSDEMMHLLRKDVKDFSELALHYNEDAYLDQGDNASTFNDAASQRSGRSVYSQANSVSVHMSSAMQTPNSAIYAVQRLLIQEKGEDTYYMLFQQKRGQMIDKIRDRSYRVTKAHEINHMHFNSEGIEANINAEDKWKQNQKLQEKRNQTSEAPRVTKYEICRPVAFIHSMISNFLEDTSKFN